MKFNIKSVEELSIAAKALVPMLNKFRIVTFSGPIGAGKTTFIKALCNELKVEDMVNSPSFAIVNEYKSLTGQIICHFDFFRIKNITEFFDIGYEEYFFGEKICLIEWPEIVEDYLPLERIIVRVEEIENGERLITINDCS